MIKMILEYAQLLYSAHHILSPGGLLKPDALKPYKLAHKNHPCSKWTRESLGNYKILARLALELCHVFERRQKKQHATQVHIEWLARNPPCFPTDSSDKPTAPPLCIPQWIKDLRLGLIRSYRVYYIAEKIGKIKNGSFMDVAPQWSSDVRLISFANSNREGFSKQEDA